MYSYNSNIKMRMRTSLIDSFNKLRQTPKMTVECLLTKSVPKGTQIKSTVIKVYWDDHQERMKALIKKMVEVKHPGWKLRTFKFVK